VSLFFLHDPDLGCLTSLFFLDVLTSLSFSFSKSWRTALKLEERAISPCRENFCSIPDAKRACFNCVLFCQLLMPSRDVLSTFPSPTERLWDFKNCCSSHIFPKRFLLPFPPPPFPSFEPIPPLSSLFRRAQRLRLKASVFFLRSSLTAKTSALSRGGTEKNSTSLVACPFWVVKELSLSSRTLLFPFCFSRCAFPSSVFSSLSHAMAALSKNKTMRERELSLSYLPPTLPLSSPILELHPFPPTRPPWFFSLFSGSTSALHPRRE